MALTVLPGQSRSSALGASVGQGLGQGLQFLLQDKLNRILQQRQQGQTASGLQALGIGKDEASQLSLLPKELLLQHFKNLEDRSFSNILQGGQPAAQGDQFGAQKLLQQLQPLESPEAPSRQPESRTRPFSLLRPGASAPEQIIQQPQEVQPQEVQPQEVQPQEVESQSDRFRRILENNPNLRSSQRLQVEKLYQDALKEDRKAQRDERKLSAQERKEQLIERREIDKENRPVIEGLNKKFKVAHEDDRRLKRMTELISKGDLTRPRFHSLLKTISNGIFGFGIDLHSLETADSQEFFKLSNEFLKGAREIFGARVTNFEAEQFLKMIPTLSQTRDGKERVIRNMQIYNEGNRIKKRAMDQIIKENKGRAPRNLESLVEDRSKEQLDVLADDFKRGLPEKKEEPKGLLDIDNPLDALLGQG